MNRKILFMVFMGLMGLILLLGIAQAYSFKQIFNPFTNRGDFYQDENYTGYGLIADNFTTSSGSFIITDNQSWNKSYADTLFASIIWNYNQTQPAMDYADANFLRNEGDIGNGDYVWVGDFNMTGIHRYAFSPSSEIPINTGNVSAGNGINDSGSSGAGTRNWSNPTNIASSDNAYASLVLLGTGVKTAWLRSNNNGFNLPSTASGCQITGIIGLIERKQTNTGDAVVNDSAVRIFDENGNPVGDNKASSTVWGSTDKVIVYGSSIDDWNAGMTCDGFNSNNSGLGVVAQTILNLGAGGAPAVDEMKLIIYYTTSNGWYSTGAIDSIDSYAISPYSYLTTANSTYFNTSGDVKTWGNFYANNGSEKVCTSENGRCNQTGIDNPWSWTATTVFNNTAGINFSLGTSESTHKFTVQGDANVTSNLDLGKNLTLEDDQKIVLGNSKNGTFYYDSANGRVVLKVT